MNRQMNRTGMILGGLTVGAGLIYFLDPKRGGQRRAMVRDQVIRGFRQSRDFIGKVTHHDLLKHHGDPVPGNGVDHDALTRMNSAIEEVRQ